MPFTFTVKQDREHPGAAGLQGRDDKIDVNFETSYQVEVSGTKTVGVDTIQAEDASWADVIFATDLPEVNRTVYTENGQIAPWLICRSVRPKKHPKRKTRWDVGVGYKGITGGNQSLGSAYLIDKPAALTNITPNETPIFGGTEKVLYEDNASTPVKIVLPSGKFFAEPVIQRVATLRIQISQYESVPLAYTTLQNRLFQTNSATYRGQAAGKWIIESIDPVEVSIELSGGATDAVLVTYVVALSPLSEGWKASRALIDDHILESSVFKPYYDGEPPTRRQVFVTSTGAKKPSQTRPDFVDFIAQGETSYSFMQA